MIFPMILTRKTFLFRFMSYTRQYPVSEDNHRKLIWLTKANNAGVKGLDVPDTASKILNTVLEGFFEKNYPGLAAFIKRRSEIDQEAVESIKS